MPEKLRSFESWSLSCDQVIAACDVEALYERMLPAGAVPVKLKQKLHEAELYPSSVTVSLGLDKPAQELGFGEEMVFLCDERVPRELALGRYRLHGGGWRHIGYRSSERREGHESSGQSV